MGTAIVMSQAGRPTSSPSKGTQTLSVASGGDLCSDHMGLPSLLSYGGEGEGKKTLPHGCSREETNEQHGSSPG